MALRCLMPMNLMSSPLLFRAFPNPLGNPTLPISGLSFSDLLFSEFLFPVSYPAFYKLFINHMHTNLSLFSEKLKALYPQFQAFDQKAEFLSDFVGNEGAKGLNEFYSLFSLEFLFFFCSFLPT
jgi:hypothetical protein